MSVKSNLEALYKEFPPEREVRLVVVSKYATIPRMIEAYESGIRDFGESRIQDAEKKLSQLPSEMLNNVRWHFIGHLQRNKIKKTLHNRFWLIQSLDSVELAEQLSRLNMEQGTRQAVLLQVNLTRESQKSGFLEEALLRDYPQLIRLPGLIIRGLMTIGPHTQQAEESRQHFCHLKSLRDQLVEAFDHPLPELSMGMSEDFQHAIACGATIVRIGNRIFEPRSFGE